MRRILGREYLLLGVQTEKAESTDDSAFGEDEFRGRQINWLSFFFVLRQVQRDQYRRGS